MASIIKKVVVLGDAGCGKNSLLTVYLTDEDLENSGECRLENEVIKVRIDRQKVEFILFNTSGEKSGRLVLFKGDGSEMRMS